MRHLLLVFALILVASTHAWSVDGVLEINQTCALETGCFSGDVAEFPVNVNAPGSYRLTSNLVVPDQNTTGIRILTNDVSVDLNGFAIIRSGCEGSINSGCSSSGSGLGVDGSPVSGGLGISVKNGSIIGMGNWGVFLEAQAEVRNLRVRWNRAGGISAGQRSIVSGNTARSNFGDGIAVSAGSVVSGNTVSNNTGGGIRGEGEGSVVSGNTAVGNSGDGIFAGNGSAVTGNSVVANSGDGIHVEGSSMVRGNAAFGNVEYGLNLDASSRTGYTENVVSTGAFSTGTVLPGKQFGQNLCDGSTAACPAAP